MEEEEELRLDLVSFAFPRRLFLLPLLPLIAMKKRGCEAEAIPGNGVLYFCFISKNKMMMAIIDGADVVNNRMMD